MAFLQDPKVAILESDDNDGDQEADEWERKNKLELIKTESYMDLGGVRGSS
jgi:hypothetical protein